MEFSKEGYVPFEVKDLAGLSQPVTKLIEVVSSAMGTYFRPSNVVRDADAKAYEIKAIARAEAEAEEIRRAVKLDALVERIESATGGDQTLAARARQRLLTREIEGQLNVEAIANEAIAALPAAVSDDSVNIDWRRKFFLHAENVCETDMQFLWGKVLAGEIATPGSFSIRTLDVLRNLSKNEAETFRRACACAMQDGWIAIPGHNLNTVLLPHGIAYQDILLLRDAGLVADGDNLHKNYSASLPVSDPSKLHLVLMNNQTLVQISGPALQHLRISSILFTTAGRELQKLIEPSPNEAYLKALGTFLRTQSLTVKRGTPVMQEGGQTILSFEDDL